MAVEKIEPIEIEWRGADNYGYLSRVKRKSFAYGPLDATATQ